MINSDSDLLLLWISAVRRPNLQLLLQFHLEHRPRQARVALRYWIGFNGTSCFVLLEEKVQETFWQQRRNLSIVFKYHCCFTQIHVNKISFFFSLVCPLPGFDLVEVQTLLTFPQRLNKSRKEDDDGEFSGLTIQLCQHMGTPVQILEKHWIHKPRSEREYGKCVPTHLGMQKGDYYR